jgi:hypothetical protein
MPDNLQWSSEQKKRAHSRIFEDLMLNNHLTEAQIISRLDDDGPKAQSTISRWKTLDVRPNRPVYLDLLKNIFRLSYAQIDAMLWLAGTPPLLRQEVTGIFGSSRFFHDKTEEELNLAAYRLLIETTGANLGLPAPQWETDQGNFNDADQFEFSINTPGEILIIKAADLPLKLEGRYWPPYSRSHMWVLLQDIYSNYYLQSPPLHFRPDGCWAADNIVPGKSITGLHFVAVGKQGNAVFLRNVQHREWGAFSQIPEDAKIIKSIPISLNTN